MDALALILSRRQSDNSFKVFSEMLEVREMVEVLSSGNGFMWAGRRNKLWNIRDQGLFPKDLSRICVSLTIDQFC